MKYFGSQADDCAWYVRAWLWLLTFLISHAPKEIKEMKIDITEYYESSKQKGGE